MDWGPWWATVHGVAKSQTRLSVFIFTSHFYALEKEMATHSSVFAWRIPGAGEPGGLPSMGSHRVGHDWSDLAAVAATIIKAFSVTTKISLMLLFIVIPFTGANTLSLLLQFWLLSGCRCLRCRLSNAFVDCLFCLRSRLFFVHHLHNTLHHKPPRLLFSLKVLSVVTVTAASWRLTVDCCHLALLIPGSMLPMNINEQ